MSNRIQSEERDTTMFEEIAQETADRLLKAMTSGDAESCEAEVENLADVIVTALAAGEGQGVHGVHTTVEWTYALARSKECPPHLLGQLRALTTVASLSRRRFRPDQAAPINDGDPSPTP